MGPLRLLLPALFFPALLPAAVVNTTDNRSPPGDGLTSLLEALSAVQEGETITFALPGPGPHYIITPDAGYPLITRRDVTLDGWSQAGSQPNTAAPDQPRNTNLQVVLDSRTFEPGERRTVVDYAGFGLSESCVLGFLNARNGSVRGLAFIGETGEGNEVSPAVYNVALIGDSPGAKIQGCWFGLDPGAPPLPSGVSGPVPGVHPAGSAVASFKDGAIDSGGLIFGTDGDGIADRGEGNLCIGHHIAIHLETPSAVIAGNWINMFPDGRPLDMVAQGFTIAPGTREAIENGAGNSMRIGTDGNGVSDPEEGNRFGPVRNNVFIEFWRPATRVVIAGNSFGTDLQDFPAFASPDTGLVAARSNSDLRIGTDGDGAGDAAEGNHIAGLGVSFVRWHSSNNNPGQRPARLCLRGNSMSRNAEAIPLAAGAPVSPDYLFADVLADSSLSVVTLDPASTSIQVRGTTPLPKAGIEAPVLDLYLADPWTQYEGRGQGRSWLGAYTVDGASDLDAAAGSFRFDTAALGLTADEVGSLIATASYKDPSGAVVTTNFSDLLTSRTLPAPLAGVALTPGPAGLSLTWQGGTPPWRVYTSTDPAGPWETLATTSLPAWTTAPAGPSRFYRIREGVPARTGNP